LTPLGSASRFFYHFGFPSVLNLFFPKTLGNGFWGNLFSLWSSSCGHAPLCARVFGCRHDLRSLRQLDHVDGRRVSPPSGMTCISTRRLEFPDRRGFAPATVPPANRIQGGLSAKPVDGDLTQPTLSAPQMGSRYRRSCRRVEPALIK